MKLPAHKPDEKPGSEDENDELKNEQEDNNESDNSGQETDFVDTPVDDGSKNPEDDGYVDIPTEEPKDASNDESKQ